MADLKAIERRDRQPCFYVQIAGINTLFGTVTPPAKTYGLQAQQDVSYQRSVSIIPGKGFEFSRGLEEEDAVIESDPISVHLVTRQHIDSSDTSDPGYVFGRLGFSAADFSAQLIDSVDTSATPTIKLSSVAGLSSGDLIHIGREAIEVGAIDVNNKTVTPPASGRGKLGTIKTRHAISADDGIYPIVTKPAVFFRGRRCVVYEGSLGPAGELPSAGDWIERFRGTIAKEPEFSTDGSNETIKLDISPITAALDRPLSHQSAKIRLHKRIHTFDGLHAEQIVFFEETKPGEYIDLAVTGQQVIAGKTYTTLNQGTAQVLDGLLPYPDNAQSVELSPLRHVRRCVMSVGVNGGGSKNGVVLDRDGDHVLLRDIDGPLRNDGDNFAGDTGSIFGNDRSIEARVCRLGRSAGAGGGIAASVLWPDHINAALQSSGLGEDSLFYGRTRVIFTPGSSTFSFVPNFSYPISNAAQLAAVPVALPIPPKVRVHVTNSPWKYKQDRVRDAENSFGIVGDYARAKEWKNLSNDFYGLSPDPNDFQPQFSASSIVPPSVISYSDDPLDNIEIVIGYNSQPTTANAQSKQSVSRSIRAKVSNAFFSAGGLFQDAPADFFDPEQYITFESDPGAPAGGSMLLDVSIGDDDPLMRIEVGPSQEITVGSHVGYVCPVVGGVFLSDVSTIVDDGGSVKDRPVFSPAVRFSQSTDVGVILLQLLLSTVGEGVSSSIYDVLPLGAGLTDDASNALGADVDVDSFLAIAGPPGVSYEPLFRSGDSILEVMRGILLSVGYALDMRVDSFGKCKLSAVPVGIPNQVDVIASISDSDIADSPEPASPARTSIRNIFKFEANYDFEGKPQFEQEVKDTISINTFGEADTVSIEMQGASLPTDPGAVVQKLKPVFSRLRLEMSYPYRLYRFNVRAGLAARMQVGGVYKVSSGRLRGLTSPGVVDAICRLRSIDGGGFDAVATVEFINYGMAGAGWAPSLAITSSNGAIQTVTETAYKPSHITEDLVGFSAVQAGDNVLVFDGVNPGAGTLTTVVSVDLAANTITLGADPGLAAPADGHPYWGYVTPAPKASASAAHDSYGFIGVTKLT